MNSKPSNSFAHTEMGTFIRTQRKANRLTQEKLAEIAGVGTRFISELERSKGTVRLSEVNRVLAIFGKTLGVVDAPREVVDKKDNT